MWRVGLQCFRFWTTNQTFKVVIEHYKNDLPTLTKQILALMEQVYVLKVIPQKSINTAQENSYITQTLVQFIKTSGSAPVFVYFTLHYEHQGRYLDDNQDVFTRKVYTKQLRMEQMG